LILKHEISFRKMSLKPYRNKHKMSDFIVLLQVKLGINTQVLVENRGPVSDRALDGHGQTNIILVIVTLDRDAVLFDQTATVGQN
jgi:hypothetical protein